MHVLFYTYSLESDSIFNHFTCFTFYSEPNTNNLLRFCYFGELISYLMSHTLWIKARNKRNLKFRPFSNCAKFVNSVVIIFSFLIFHLGILFMFYFLTVFPVCIILFLWLRLPRYNKQMLKWHCIIYASPKKKNLKEEILNLKYGHAIHLNTLI